MVSETLSRANDEFQQGNFEVASTLYAEAVANFDQEKGDTKELAGLVQKLAESEYALNKYDQAREAYARLVALHGKAKFANKDKVSALLKLAKSSEKCDDANEAEKHFQSAYDLAKSLSAKHFLRRTVLDGYCDFLRASKRNTELLEQLEDELGIKKEEKKAEPAADLEIKPDDIPTPVVAKPAGEQEYFVLRSRLTKFSRKKEAAPPQEGEEKSATVLDKKADKTVEQEVAERKFLRKGQDKDKPEDRTSRRSKLRSAMTSERSRPPEGEEQAESQSGPQAEPQSGPQAEPQEREVTEPAAKNKPNAASVRLNKLSKAEMSQIDSVSETAPGPRHVEVHRDSLPQELYPTAAASNVDVGLPSGAVPYEVDYTLPERNLAKFVGRRPKRSLRDTGHDMPAITSIANPSLAVEPVSMPEATRSFLQTADAVKKASDEEVVAPDVVPLRVEGRVETIVPASQKVATSLKFASPVLGVLLVLVAGAFMIANMAPPKQAPVTPAFIVEMLGRKFVTADGSLSLIVNRNVVEVNGAVNRPAKLRFWKGDWRDELSLLQGTYNKTRWLTVMPGGLKDENGPTFYALDAPERKVVSFAKQVSDAALEYYKTNNKFPVYGTVDIASASTYLNPFTGRSSTLSICSAVDSKNTSSTVESKLDLDLQKGGSFKGEATSFPGAVYAFSVSGQPQFAEASNTYTWATQCFYIHAFDRNNKLIAGDSKDSVFLITLKNGYPAKSSLPSSYTEYGGADIGITEMLPPRGDAVAGKYLAILGIVIFLVGLVVLSQMSSRLRGRIRR